MFSYSAYGLSIGSTLPLLDLVPGESEKEVVIRRARVDMPASEPQVEGNCFKATSKEVLLFWEEVGKILVRRGREIIVDPAAGVEEGVLALSILGPAMAVLLHQRRLLVLHASAVAVDGTAVAFLGKEGWGKSTLAAALYHRGHSVVADDVTAVNVDGNVPIVYPGFPQLKLGPDVVLSSWYRPGKPQRLDLQFEKWVVQVTDRFPRTSLPVRRLYILEEGDDQTIESLNLQDAFEELVRHSYCAKLLPATGSSIHFLQCANLVQNVSIRLLKRCRSLSAIPRLARMVEEDLAHAL